LLLVPIVLPLIPGLYNRMEPTLFGLPFFYWSQLGFAFLASAVITVVHLKVR
jgi:cellobiose-specific phosphotransferase system component IIC